MKHYYITDPNAERGFVELTESEFYAIVGMLRRGDSISLY